jgi:hypothetical protein
VGAGCQRAVGIIEGPVQVVIGRFGAGATPVEHQSRLLSCRTGLGCVLAQEVGLVHCWLVQLPGC